MAKRRDKLGRPGREPPESIAELKARARPGLELAYARERAAGFPRGWPPAGPIAPDAPAPDSPKPPGA